MCAVNEGSRSNAPQEQQPAPVKIVKDLFSWDSMAPAPVVRRSPAAEPAPAVRRESAVQQRAGAAAAQAIAAAMAATATCLSPAPPAAGAEGLAALKPVTAAGRRQGDCGPGMSQGLGQGPALVAAVPRPPGSSGQLTDHTRASALFRMSRRVKIGDGKKKKAKMQGISGGDPGAASSGFIAWGVAALALLAALFFVVQYWVFTTDALKKEKKLLDGLDRAPVPGKPRLYTYEVCQHTAGSPPPCHAAALLAPARRRCLAPASLPPRRLLRRRGRASSSVQAVCPLQVVAEHKHDPKAFTQGLLCKDEPRGEGEQRCARFWESTGLYGETSVRVVDRLTGKVVKQQVSKRPFCAI